MKLQQKQLNEDAIPVNISELGSELIITSERSAKFDIPGYHYGDIGKCSVWYGDFKHVKLQLDGAYKKSEKSSLIWIAGKTEYAGKEGRNTGKFKVKYDIWSTFTGVSPYLTSNTISGVVVTDDANTLKDVSEAFMNNVMETVNDLISKMRSKGLNESKVFESTKDTYTEAVDKNVRFQARNIAEWIADGNGSNASDNEIDEFFKDHRINLSETQLHEAIAYIRQMVRAYNNERKMGEDFWDWMDAKGKRFNESIVNDPINEALVANAKDMPEIQKLCNELGIITVADLDKFMTEPENKGKSLIDALRTYRYQLGADFQIKEKLTESSERTLFSSSEEYAQLKKAVDKLNQASKDKKYFIQDTYLDWGLDWKWTTIIAEDIEKKGNLLSTYQVLNPRDWKLITSGDFDLGLKNVFEQEGLTLTEGFSAPDFKHKLTQRFIDSIKVNAPDSRGDKMPAFSKFSINESEFEDNMRYKNWGATINSNGNIDITWITQEPFTDEDVPSFMREVERGLNALAELEEFIEPIRVNVHIEARDGANYGSYDSYFDLNDRKIEESKQNSNVILAFASCDVGAVDIYEDRAILTYYDLEIEDVPYGSVHDTNYYEEPYYDTTTVNLSDFEYEAYVDSVYDIIYDSLTEEDYKNISDIDSDDEINKYVESNLEKLLERNCLAILYRFEDDAKEDAFDTAVEYAGSYDEKLKIKESVNIDYAGTKSIVKDALIENNISFDEVDGKISTKYDRSVLSILSKALTGNGFILVDFDQEGDTELFVYSEDITLPNSDEVETRSKVYVTSYYEDYIIVTFTDAQLAGLEIKETENIEESIQYDDIEDTDEHTNSSEYVVTHYEMYPLFEPAEGGYYYDGVSIVKQFDCATEEEARDIFNKLVDELDLNIRGLNNDFADSKYTGEIGEGEFIQIESNTDDRFERVGSGESGKQIYN